MDTKTERGWLERFFDTPVGGSIGIVSYILTFLVTAAAFFGSWAYAIATYGWFLGGTLGWVPAIVIAFIVFIAFQVLAPFVVVFLVIAVVVVIAAFFLR